VRSAVEKPVLGAILEAVDGAVHGGAGAVREVRNPRRLLPSMKQEGDAGTERLDPAAGLLGDPRYPSSAVSGFVVIYKRFERGQLLKTPRIPPSVRETPLQAELGDEQRHSIWNVLSPRPARTP
jgi:hypothetical protein